MLVCNHTHNHESRVRLQTDSNSIQSYHIIHWGFSWCREIGGDGAITVGESRHEKYTVRLYFRSFATAANEFAASIVTLVDRDKRGF